MSDTADTAPSTEALQEKVRRLIKEFGCVESCELIEELIVTALRIGRDQLNVADLKLFNRALREMRYASRVFAPYSNKRKVVVFGSARTPEQAQEFKAAELFGAKMRDKGYMIMTGGGDGIMGAAQRGAGREDSFGLNIRLPFEQRANETIDGDSKLLNFNYFFTRKLNFVKEAHAVALFPGGFGTLDEAFEVLTLMQTGKAKIMPLVLVDKEGGGYWETWHEFLHDYLLKHRLVSPEDFHFFKMTHDVDEAVEEILRFYRNFHSYRWVGKTMVIRLQRRLTEKALSDLNSEFADLLDGGRIEQGTALEAEALDVAILELPRLIIASVVKNFGRIRQLIDAVNAAETE